MKIPRYWAREEQEVKTTGRKSMLLSCWGWSVRNQQEAREKASGRLQAAVARVTAGDRLERYPYGRGPLREEVIESLEDKRGGDLAVVTRNAYGALVLNSASAMFMDVDLPPEKPVSGLSRLIGRLFGKPEPNREHAEERILDQIERWAALQFGLDMRIYRTAAGFRCIVTNRVYEPAGDKALEMMKSLGCDPLYIRLCKDQGSFRARLTPKPWRIHVAKPSWRWPFKDDREERLFRKWEEKYRRASLAYSVCRLDRELGSGKVHPEIAPVLALHDRMCCSPENRRLA